MKKYPLVSIVIPTHNRKDKLIRLIDSILRSNYPNDKLEIIVVDDASTDGTYEEITKRYGDLIDKKILKIIRTEKEVLLAGARNLGIKNSKGKYIFLIDDDNVVDKDVIRLLVEFMEKYPEVGVVAPLMLYYDEPDRIWCAGIRRNYITSLTTFLYKDKKANEIKEEIIESEDFPNAFMVKRDVFEKVGLFNNKDFPIHYDEGDFCARARKAGYKVVCYTKAKVWHDVRRSKVTGFETEWRTYYTARNRIIFHKKYTKKYQFLFFIFFFNWLITLYYIKLILFDLEKPVREKVTIVKAYLKGIIDGVIK